MRGRGCRDELNWIESFSDSILDSAGDKQTRDRGVVGKSWEQLGFVAAVVGGMAWSISNEMKYIQGFANDIYVSNPAQSPVSLWDRAG